MSERTIDSSGRDTVKTRKTPEQRRIDRLEMTIRVIRTWAICWDSAFETPQKAFFDITRKCDEALKEAEP